MQSTRACSSVHASDGIYLFEYAGSHIRLYDYNEGQKNSLYYYKGTVDEELVGDASITTHKPAKGHSVTTVFFTSRMRAHKSDELLHDVKYYLNMLRVIKDKDGVG